jgi:hypothetical protein
MMRPVREGAYLQVVTLKITVEYEAATQGAISGEIASEAR